MFDVCLGIMEGEEGGFCRELNSMGMGYEWPTVHNLPAATPLQIAYQRFHNYTI